MHGEVSVENMVPAPASSVWEIYRGSELGHFVNQHLSHLLGTSVFTGGDGGVGSLVRLKYPSGSEGGDGYMTERFRVMDDEKRIKEVEEVEGGHLDLGFNSMRVRLEIIENGTHSCIIKSTVLYDIDDHLAHLVHSHVSTRQLSVLAQTVINHLQATA